MATTSRKRNPRRVVVDMLKSIGLDQRYMARVWGQSQQVYDPVTENGKTVSSAWRKRRDDEKVENQQQRWSELYAYAERMEREARELKTFAAARFYEMEPADPTDASSPA